MYSEVLAVLAKDSGGGLEQFWEDMLRMCYESAWFAGLVSVDAAKWTTDK